VAKVAMKLDDMATSLRLFPDSNWLFPAATLQSGQPRQADTTASAVLVLVENPRAVSVAIQLIPPTASGGSREGNRGWPVQDSCLSPVGLKHRSDNHGGADVAEPFPVSGDEALAPGEVHIIDEE